MPAHCKGASEGYTHNFTAHCLGVHAHLACSMHAQVDAGLDKKLVLGDPKAPRFVFWNKKLRPTPSGPDVLTFDLLSIWGKLRAGIGAVGIKQKPPGGILLSLFWRSRSRLDLSRLCSHHLGCISVTAVPAAVGQCCIT